MHAGGPGGSGGSEHDRGFAIRDRRWWAPQETDGEPGHHGDAPQPRGGNRGDAGANAESAGERRPTHVQTLEAEIARLTELVAEKDQRARESAVLARQATEELERAKQRIQKDADREIEQKKRSILLDFLEVLDDLDRAVAAAVPGADGGAVVEGVELVRKRFAATLARSGVAHLPALGQPFDPERHEAVSTIAVADPDRDGTVVGVIREGYLIGDETLRPATVAVGKLPS